MTWLCFQYNFDERTDFFPMSASREKKQRQGGTPNDKTLSAQQQADQTRRKTIQYTVIGVVIAVLVAALLIWNSGLFQAGATAVKVGGTNYSTAEASYFYHGTQAYQSMMQYGQYLGYDTSKAPADQPFDEDGRTYHDYFLDAALTSMTTTTALYDASLADPEHGVTAADVADEVDSAIEQAKQIATQYGMSYKQFLKTNYGPYMTPSVYKDCVTRSVIASRYQQSYSSSLDYTIDELTAYYNENAGELDTFQYSNFYFSPAAVETKDADGNDIEMTDEERTAKEEENLAAAKEQAEAAKAALEAGDSAEDVAAATSPTSYGSNEETQGISLNSVYSEWLTAGERQPGDVELIENGASGYFVVMYHGRYLDEAPSVDTRHILIQAEMDENASSPTEEQMAAAKAKAEELLNEWKAGDATEESFAELANANSSDGGSNTNGGLYEKVYKGQFVTNYDAWLFDSARQPGDTDIVENQGYYYGYHVVYYVKQNPDYLSWMSQSKALKSAEDYESWLTNLEANCTAEAASAAKYLGE